MLICVNCTQMRATTNICIAKIHSINESLFARKLIFTCAHQNESARRGKKEHTHTHTEQIIGFSHSSMHEKCNFQQSHCEQFNGLKRKVFHCKHTQRICADTCGGGGGVVGNVCEIENGS